MREIILGLRNIVGSSIKIAAGLALVYFFWGLVKFIFHAGDEGKHEEGKNIMIWGIVALFVMFSVWGLINFIGEALSIPGYQSEYTNPCLDPVTGQVLYGVGDCGTF